MTSTSAALAVDAQSVMVDLLLLRQPALERAGLVARAARHAGEDWHAFAVEALAIPLTVALGDLRSVKPWAVALLAETQAAEAHYRAADVAVIGIGVRACATVEAPDLTPVHRMRRNTHAQWRARLTDLRSALLRGLPEESQACIEELRRLASVVNPGMSALLPAMRGVLRAFGIPDAATRLAPDFPDRLTLVNLPVVLAGIEAAAMSGSQDECVAWNAWIERSWPTDVHTSLEWSALIERLRALIEVRIGREGAGFARMQRAARWAKEHGFIVEQRTAELQLAELTGLLDMGTHAVRWREQRAEARGAVRAIGGDPVLLAYAASDAVTVGRIEGSEPKLSPREVQVLALLADGLTYRAAARELGIEWRTVQVHAKHIYGKLGVHTKVQAARRAEELGII